MQTQAFHFLNFLGGAQTATSPFLLADNDLEILDNCLISYKLGAIIKRLGYSQIGATLQSAKSITGLHNFRQTASTQKMLATVDDATSDDTQLFYSTGGAWTEVGDAETAWANKAGINVEMEDFIGYCFFVGYGATDGFLPVASLTGTTFSTSTNVTDMPQGKYIKRYRDRLYVANLYDGGALPYRVGYSNIPSGGTISWSEYQADTAWIDVDYSEEITGLGENWDRLVIFTPFSAYIYDQTFKKKAWDVGCSNHRTIKNAGAYMFWANRDGVWRSTGGRPENIAGRMIDFIRYATPTNFFAEVVDEEYYLYVGNVTVNGISYTNTRIVFNLLTETWRIEEMYEDIDAFAAFNNSGKLQLYMGCADGEVMVQSKYTDTTPIYTDDGNPIHSWFQTRPYHLGNPAIEKDITKVIAYADRAVGLHLKARILNNNTRALTEFKSLGELKGYITELGSPDTNKGNLIQFEGVENGSLPYWSFYGISVLIEQDSKF